MRLALKRVTPLDNFGMWLNLDPNDSDLPANVGSGLAVEHTPIATYPLSDLIGGSGIETAEFEPGSNEETENQDEASSAEPHTISEVMEWARKRIATLSGVRVEAVKLDCRLET